MINLGKINKSNGKEVILTEKSNGCIECISHCKDSDGYIRIMVNNKQTRLHRYIYELYNGEIPSDMVIRHKCDNPSCCNIKHLEIGTQLDNVQDRVLRNRTRNKPIYGTKNGQHKLTEKEVCEIFKSNLSCYKLSKEYKVSKKTILDIKHQRTWKWLTTNDSGW